MGGAWRRNKTESQSADFLCTNIENETYGACAWRMPKNNSADGVNQGQSSDDSWQIHLR